MRRILFLAALLALALSCGRRAKAPDTPEAILAQMRADTAWRSHLDSLAQTAIGPSAKCIDPVSHTFSCDGRTWMFNQDWGGVLEIPSDYLVEDDLWQAELSFHGTRAWSTDSLVLVSYYGGFQPFCLEEAEAEVLSGLEEDGFAVLEKTNERGVFIVRARSAEGINYYGRHLFCNEDGLEFSVSVQYPDEKAAEAVPVMRMADRYPAGPNGTVFRGEALL